MTPRGFTVIQIYPAGDRGNEKGPRDHRMCIITLINASSCRYPTFDFDGIHIENGFHGSYHRLPCETDEGIVDSERAIEWLTGEPDGP